MSHRDRNCSRTSVDQWIEVLALNPRMVPVGRLKLDTSLGYAKLPIEIGGRALCETSD